MANVLDIIKTGRLPYNYKVGEKSSGKPLPFDVKLSIDPQFRKTVLQSVGMLAGGIALGTIAGFLLTKKK